MDVQWCAGGRRERPAAEVQLGCLFGGVDRGDEEQVGDGGGERFTLVYIFPMI